MRNLTQNIQALGIGKGSVITVTGLALIGGLLMAGWAFHGWTQGLASAEVTRHVDRDLDVAHPTIKARYVSQTEMNGQLQKIRTTVNKIDTAQQVTKSQLDSIKDDQRKILDRITAHRYRPRRTGQ